MNKDVALLCLALLIASVCLVIPSSAIEPAMPRGFNLTAGGYDNFQYESDTEIDEHWVAYESTSYANIDIEANTPSGYTYNKVCHLYITIPVWGQPTATLKNKNCSVTNYWSFRMLSYSTGDYGSVWLYDYDNVEITHFTLSSYVDSGGADTGLWEFVRVNATGDIYFYVNGVNMKAGGGAIGNSAKEFGYIMLRVEKPNHYTSAGGAMYVDDFNNYDSGYGFGGGLGSYGYDYNIHEDDPTTISYSYTLQHYPASDYGNHIYKLKVTNRITGEVLSSETVTADCGNRNFDRSSLLGFNYGLYKFYTEKDGTNMYHELLLYIPPGGEGSTIGFSEDRVVVGENVSINYDIANYDSGTYDYKIYIYDYTSEEEAVLKSFTLDSSSGSVSWDTADFSEGYYMGTLQRITKANPDQDRVIAYASTQLVEMIRISGYTYNAVTGAALSGVNVVYKQGATSYSDTSNVSGYYMVDDLTSSAYTLVNASKASYEHHNWSFTPESGFKDIDLYLFPSDMSPYPRVAGLVLSIPYYQAIEGASVQITNYSWSDSNTTTETGFYEFDEADGVYSTLEYMMNASATGYFTSSNTNVTAAAASLTEQWFALEPSLTLSLRVKDRESGGYISTFNATIGNTTYDTTSGLLEISGLTFKWYEMTVQAPLYAYTITAFLMEADRSMEIELSLLPSEYQAGVGLYLPPHDVRFTIQDIFFRKKEDVTVTVEYIDSAISWDTLISMHGYNEDTFSANESMTGVTDSDGRVVFSMIPAARYEMKFKNDVLGIDKTWNIYPHDDKYTVYVDSGLFSGVDSWLADQPSMMGDEVIITFTTNQITEARCYLNITYNDTLQDTNSVYFFVNYSNATVLNSKTKTLDYYEYSYLVSNISGNTFIYGVTADHGEYGELREAKVVYFYKRKVVIDGWSETYYLVAGLAFSFLIGIVFSGHSVKNGAVVFPIFCWIFWYMGWMNYTGIEIILGIIMAIGVAYYVTARGREEHIT